MTTRMIWDKTFCLLLPVHSTTVGPIITKIMWESSNVLYVAALMLRGIHFSFLLFYRFTGCRASTHNTACKRVLLGRDYEANMRQPLQLLLSQTERNYFSILHICNLLKKSLAVSASLYAKEEKYSRFG
jgi:hypothetical protein